MQTFGILFFFFWIKWLVETGVGMETLWEGAWGRGVLVWFLLKHYAKSILGRKGFIWLTGPITAHYPGKSGHKLQAVTEAELMGLFCRTTCLRLILLTMGWALPHQSLVRKVLHRLVYSPVWWKQFLNWGFLSPVDLSLCPVDQNWHKRLSTTTGPWGAPSNLDFWDPAFSSFL